MAYSDCSEGYESFPIADILADADSAAVLRALAREKITHEDFIVLLSDAADEHLEAMAKKAAELTRRHFGGSVLLFTPLYISNYCTNSCAYCSYARHNSIRRAQLSTAQIAAEAAAIAATGLRHLLVLTGEAPTLCTFEYIRESLRTIAGTFSSVAIEMYPMATEEYRILADEGLADSMTIYQETYDRRAYAEVHPDGPKSDFTFRINAPERAASAGMHAVTLGPLLGLSEWRREVLATVLHIEYLLHAFPGLEIAVSFPRLCPQAGEFEPEHPVDDRAYVRLLCAIRILFPFIGITLSTRESAALRDGMLQICVTKISAGVSTAVGGHAADEAGDTQFEITDSRSVAEVEISLRTLGLCPVYVDWNTRQMSGH